MTWFLVALLSALCIPEMVLLGADLGFWGSPTWRLLALSYGAFWSGLLRGWQSNFALQPLAMFLTYAFLHAGPAHLLGNVAALLFLGKAAAPWLGPRGMALVLAAAAWGGAATFALLSSSPSPMVGASGMVFGLAGTLAVRAGVQGDKRQCLGLALALAASNTAMWATMEQVAWETHLGGAFAGAATAALMARRNRRQTLSR